MYKDSDGVTKMPVNLYYKEKIVIDPFEPILEKVVNFRDDLTETGLALKWRITLPESQKRLNNNYLKNEKILENIEEGQSLLDISSSSDSEEFFIDAHPWPLPQIPDASELHDGIISHIDIEGQIYFQSEDNVKAIKAMTTVLEEKMSRTAEPIKRYNWCIGDRAIVQHPIGQISH